MMRKLMMFGGFRRMTYKLWSTVAKFAMACLLLGCSCARIEPSRRSNSFGGGLEKGIRLLFFCARFFIFRRSISSRRNERFFVNAPHRDGTRVRWFVDLAVML